MSVTNIEDEPSFNQAMASPDKKSWLDAMDDEITSQEDNGTWVVERVPKGAKTIGSRWVFKRKRDRNGHTRSSKLEL